VPSCSVSDIPQLKELESKRDGMNWLILV